MFEHGLCVFAELLHSYISTSIYTKQAAAHTHPCAKETESIYTNVVCCVHSTFIQLDLVT